MDEISELRNEVNDTLERVLPSDQEEPCDVNAALRYCVLGGGHRWRPLLLMETGTMYGCPASELLAPAAAVELLHCASIILDDLPCMDNADTRRGKPACHVKFGEATTILASQKLTILALTMLQSCKSYPSLTELGCEVVRNMIAGQSTDLRLNPSPTNGPLTRALLEQTHLAKTGTIIRFAVRIGALLGQAPREDTECLDTFATDLSLAYQFLDDVADADGSAVKQGKPAHLDHSKLSAVSVYGLEGARHEASVLLCKACNHLESLSGDTKLLTRTANMLCGCPVVQDEAN